MSTDSSDALDEGLRLERAHDEARARAASAHQALEAAVRRDAPAEVVQRLSVAYVEAAEDARQARQRVYEHNALGIRDYFEELRAAYEAHGNLFALRSALSASPEVDDLDAPFSADRVVYVPGWVVDACIAFVEQAVARDSDPTKERFPRWLRNHRERRRDQARWVVFAWCLERGVQKLEARVIAAEFCGEETKTFEKAIYRIEAMRRTTRTHLRTDAADTLDPVFMPAVEAMLHTPKLRPFIDAASGEDWPDNLPQFTAWMNEIRSEAAHKPELKRFHDLWVKVERNTPKPRHVVRTPRSR